MPILSGQIWLILILVIVLIIFGPGNLPQIGGAVGNALREFRKATDQLKDEVVRATDQRTDSAVQEASIASTVEGHTETPAPHPNSA